MGFNSADDGGKKGAEIMQAPHIYAEWARLLDSLANGLDDAATVDLMQRGTLEWQTGVAERFTRKLADTVNARMNAAVDRFQKTYRQGGESGLVQALLALRKELSFLAKAVDLPALPDKERQEFISLVQEQADNIQESLDDSAKKDRTGKMGSIVRGHRINVF